jgi:hypothetical protein
LDSCCRMVRLATAAAVSWPPAVEMSRTHVRNQRRTTNPAKGFCDAPRMGHLLGYASACHHRPAAPAPGRRPPARRLTGRSPRPPAAPGATAPPTASLSTSSAPATPWTPGDWSASAALCGIRSTPSPAWPSAASRRRPRHHPRRQVRLLCLVVLAEFERDRIRERTAAGLAAARARGRRGDRPSVLTVARVRWLS